MRLRKRAKSVEEFDGHTRRLNQPVTWTLKCKRKMGFIVWRNHIVDVVEDIGEVVAVVAEDSSVEHVEVFTLNTKNTIRAKNKFRSLTCWT